MSRHDGKELVWRVRYGNYAYEIDRSTMRMIEVRSPRSADFSQYSDAMEFYESLPSRGFFDADKPIAIYRKVR